MTAAPAAPAAPDVRASLRVVGYLAGSWLLLLVVGFLSLRSPTALAASNRVSGDRAAFESINVGALAGFTLDFARPDDFAPAVRAVFVMQTLSGALLALAGGGILWARLLNRRHSDARLTATALLLMAVAGALGCATVRHGESTATAAVRGVSALGCGGVLFGNAVPPAAAAFKFVLVPLCVLGSLGVVVVTDCVARLRRRPVSIGHASRVLALTAGVYVVGVAVIALLLHDADTPWQQTLVRADALVWSAHAWGLAGDYASSWPGGVLAAVLAVAAVGTGSAGSASAFGLGWLVTAPKRLQAVVVNGLFAQGVLASLTLAGLALFDSTLVPARRLLVAVSAVMNLGLSHEPLNLTGAGLFVLAAAVLAGKLLPLAVFALALRRKGAP